MKNGARADAEVDRRDAEASNAIEDPFRMRQDELAIVLRVELSDPRVEHLYGIDARIDLRGEVLADDVGQQIAERMPRLRVAVHQRFGMCE